MLDSTIVQLQTVHTAVTFTPNKKITRYQYCWTEPGLEAEVIYSIFCSFGEKAY